MTKDKREHYRRYGWKCSEENLKTLPPEAPQAAKDLTQWLTLEGRRSSLEEWIGHVDSNGLIHGKFWHIGAWTHRMSHSSPNKANIVSPYPDGRPVETDVDRVKVRYDKHLRALWGTEKEGTWLVGVDADAIQLRILTHYMKSKEWAEAIESGDKKLGTDIHSVNMRALGPVCKSRDDSKTFIYAWLLGAGTAKVANILGCSTSVAQKAVSDFVDRFPELKRLKKVEIPRDASRGYFVGLDGRKVLCTSEHLMLAGYLQNGEAVVMKHAFVLWNKWVREMDLPCFPVDFVHDEWQTIVHGTKEQAEEVAKLQIKAIEETGKNLGLFLPLRGEAKIGKNWSETH